MTYLKAEKKTRFLTTYNVRILRNNVQLLSKENYLQRQKGFECRKKEKEIK